jgi:monovalent cation:proton antiporter-2 (CPA2) family protein
MHSEGFFFSAFVYLTAAVLAVPLAKRLPLGSVLGYLLAGIVIGPFVLGLVGEEGQDVMHFAEFGVVMMLFVVGLELEPAVLWRLRLPIVGLGGSQVTVTTAVAAALGVALGVPWQEALAIGMVLAMSSTAIVLQTLDEKGLMKTGAGQSAFAVLLFQDIAVIPMLAVLPLLATHPVAAQGGGHASTWVVGLPGWATTLVVLGAVSAIVVGGHYILRPAFRYIARARLREVFVAAALLLVIGIALLMTKVGLSPALGTFVAGVVLASSEYRHELESDLEPFKGLLLGLFFIAVGASIDFRIIASSPGLIAGLVAALMVGKFLVLIGLARLFKLGTDQTLLFGFALAQGGEFAFVLFSFASQKGVLPVATTGPLVVVVAVSMALTPLAMLAFERFIQKRVGTKVKGEGHYDDVHGGSPVIIAGFGRFGQIAARLLEAEGIGTTVLEYDSDQVELLRRFGRKVYYGDASRYDLLKAAGADSARLLILAIDRPEKTLELVQTARKHFPHLQILARASGRVDAYDLLAEGVDRVYRETFDSALRLGTDALHLLGGRAYRAHRAALRFRRHDEALLREMAGQSRDDTYVAQVRRRNAEIEETLRRDMHDTQHHQDDGWDAESLVAEYGGGQEERRGEGGQG